MKIETSNSEPETLSLGRYLTPVGMWALSFGAAVGWGAFVMPGTTFLPVAGPVGTAIGIGVGALVMLLIGINYVGLMKRYPDAGGAYSYVKRICNYDHGYLCAWFLILTYLAIAWANATALAVIGRSVLSGVFAVGPHYTLAGYEIYLGEVGLSLAALVATGIFLVSPKRLGSRIEIVMAFVLFFGILVAFGAALWKNGGISHMVMPEFSLKGRHAVQIFSIIALAPWAYVGFESVSHSMEEMKFRTRYLVPSLLIVLLTSAFAYAALTLVAASAQPGGCSNWQEYVAQLGSFKGVESMPAFYAIKAALGKYGVTILCLAALSAIGTGLIAHLLAASRLVFSLSRDGLLPKWFGTLNRHGNPQNAIVVLVAFSCFVPLLGRTAIGWIVDVTTIGSCIAYAYVSFCAFRTARSTDSHFLSFCGLLGLVISIGYILYFMMPTFWSVGALAEESYFILAGWCILGFVSFRGIFSRDRAHRLGKSTVVWLALLFMIFFASHMWMRQATHRLTQSVLTRIGDYYHMDAGNPTVHTAEQDEKVMADERDVIDDALTFDNFIQMTLVVLALGIMFSIYSTMSKREHAAAKAKEYFFSTVSHDIRTPLNAIIGYSQMMKLGFNSKEEQEQAVDNILVSGETLMRLINDILDLSALEAGKMSIEPTPTDCVKLLGEIIKSFDVAGNRKKAVELRAKFDAMPQLLLDPLRLRQIAFNLIGNGLKFTEKGHVFVKAYFVPEKGVSLGTFCFEVEDTGIGISEEDLEKIAAPYVQVGSKLARHGGTGLGLAICKQLVNAMGGSMLVSSQLGVGSTFRVEIPRIRMKQGVDLSEGLTFCSATSAADAKTPPPAAAAPTSPDASATPPPPVASAIPQVAAVAASATPAAPAAPAMPVAAAAPATPTAPVASAAPAAPHAPTAALIVKDSAAADSSDPSAPKSKARLLLVDDSKMNLMVLKALLKKVGNFDVETAADGKQAVERLEQKDQPAFDGVLTDMWMPEMDGAGLAAVIREHPELSSLPVYVVTADVELQKDYNEKGFDDILLKPVTLDLLKSKCQQLFEST